MIKSSLFNYELPKTSINQIPYQNPLDSKLLIADSKKIIYFKDLAQNVKKILCLYLINQLYKK